MPEFTSANAIVLSTKPLGENVFIVSLFTSESGRHLGVLKRKHPPEIGTLCHAIWKARLPEQLGRFYLEEIKTYAPLLLDDISRLHVLSNLCVTLDKVLPERQQYSQLHQQTLSFLQDLENENFYERYIHFEMDLLAALGFALDLSACAAGGDRDHLAYISPKTGRAVSKEKGLPYHDKLLKLPGFLWKEDVATAQDLMDGLTLTGHFLQEHLGQLPSTRFRLYANIKRRTDG